MAPMAKKKKPSKEQETAPESPETPAREGVNYNFWLEDEVAEVVQQYRHDQDVLPSKTGLFRSAIIEFLAKRGYWPPTKK